jgi:hypothetical protein
MLSTISDRNYDIHGYNFINRILIYIQNKYATALKGEAGWQTIGRVVKSKNSPIWVLDNILKVEYIDPKTNEVITDLDLNISEVDEAVKVGVIKKEVNIEGIRIIPVFNIKDTELFDAYSYKEYRTQEKEKRELKISELLKIAKKDFDITCVKTQRKSYFKNNKLYIGVDGYTGKVEAITEAIYSKVGLESNIESFKSDYDVDDNKLNIIMSVCKAIFVESVKSYCLIDYNVERTSFKIVEELDFSNNDILQCFMQAASYIYDVIEELICLLNPTNRVISESSLRKAEELLNILEAHEALSRLRGD